MVGELGGQDDGRVGAGELERERQIAIAIGARTGDHQGGG